MNEPLAVDGYLPRYVDATLDDVLRSFPIVVLDGPRGAGKTTTASRLARSIIQLPRDIDRLRVDASALLADLPTPVLIDEWQLAGTDFLWTLKRLVDDDPTPGRFILVGSVEPATYGPTYPLTGRATRLVMRPMTRAERSGRGDRPGVLHQVIDGWRPTQTAGQSSQFELPWLWLAGFPASRLMSDTSLFLEGYAALVAQRAGDEGRDAARLMRTMRVLATLEGQAVPDQRVWEAADVNKATFKVYADLLERVHIAAPLGAFESNRLKRLTSYPKRFTSDVALALTLAGLDVDLLAADPGLAGHYVESFVVQQLRPQVDAVRGAMFHLRTGSGEREIDVIVEVGTSIYAFEVKYGTTPTSSDARHLQWLRDGLGDRFVAGFVVHTGGDTSALGDRLWALPIHHL